MRKKDEFIDAISDHLDRAKGIAWDKCHKIYILMDDEQMSLMREYGYDPLISSNEANKAVMEATVLEWYEDSCLLRFVEAVSTNEDPIKGFESLIPQFWEDDEDEE